MASIFGGADEEAVMRERWRYIQGRERIVVVRAGLEGFFPFVVEDMIVDALIELLRMVRKYGCKY